MHLNGSKIGSIDCSGYKQAPYITMKPSAK